VNISYRLNTIIGTLLLLTSLFYASMSVAASLISTVDRNVISIAESFALQIEANDVATASEPDFSLLEKDFEILSRNVSHNYQSINGVNSRRTSWRLQLMAKRLGELQIPSFSLEDVKSQALVVKVEKQQITGKEDTDFDLVLLANKPSVIAQEQIVVTLRFLYAKHVNNLQASEMILDNAQVIKLNDKQYETRRNGRHFGVYEVNYAVFAERTGEVVIPAQKIQVQLGRGSIFNNTRGKTIALQSDPLTIEVRAGAISNQHYIVADALSLQESWAGSTTLSLGESITREINLNLSGAKAATIAALSMADIDGIKIYPEVAIKNEKKTDEGLVTSRARSFALVPTKAGKVVIPAFEIRWWNTQENKLETARLPAKTIEVIAPAKSLQAKPVEPTETIDKTVVKTQKVIEKVLVTNPINRWLLVTCVILSVIVLSLMWVIFRQKKQQITVAKTVEVSEDGKEKLLFEQLMTALKHNDDAAIYHSTVRWALHSGVSLQADEAVRASVAVIEQRLYSVDSANTQWDRPVFIAKLQHLRKKSLLKEQYSQSSFNLYPNYSGAKR